MLEQSGDPTGQLGHDLFLSRHHCSNVDGGLLHPNTMVGVMLCNLLVLVRAIQQGLGGYAADIEAGTSQHRLALVVQPLLDHSDFLTQLGTADGADVARWASTNNQNIEMCCHVDLPELRAFRVVAGYVRDPQ